MDCEDQTAIQFMNDVKRIKTGIDPWYAQARRDLTLIHPHPYSSPIMGDWLFVYGYERLADYRRAR
jgi:hypothetical protein